MMKRVLKEVLGVDVAQKELVVTVGRMFDDLSIDLYAHKVFKINEAGFVALLGWIKKLTSNELKVRFVMEATGIYHQKFAFYLHDHCREVTVVLPNRSTKISAKALLAKVYLNQNNWDNAYAIADEIIKSNQYALVTNAAYTSSWTGSVPSTESIFELAIETSFNGNGLGAYYDIANTNYRMFAATTDITALYSNTDVRRAGAMFNTVTIGAVNYLFTKKYSAGGTAQTPIKVLRLSDLYLFRAESAVEKSTADFVQANSDLNAIRKRGDASATAVNLTMKSDLIDAILLERRKELAFEGNLLFDLLRRKKDLVRVDVIATNKNLLTNDPKLIMPLPAVTVNTNNNIVQNTGY